MCRLRQNFFRCIGLWILSTASLQAQTDSAATARAFSPLERIAVLDISETPLKRKPSQSIATALEKICRDDARFVVASENALAAYLKKRRQFSIFVSDSVLALCKNLALQHLLIASAEPAASAAPDLWQITLRWLDGNTGQITKIHAGEYNGDLGAPETFPLREMISTLLESPDIIVPMENALAEMPLPEINAPTIESENLIQPPNKRGRSWLWFVAGAALASGGSAAILLKNPAKSGVTGKALLPEPPDPPR